MGYILFIYVTAERDEITERFLLHEDEYSIFIKLQMLPTALLLNKNASFLSDTKKW